MGRYKCVLCKASRWTIRRRRRVDHFSMMYTGCVRKRLTVGAKFFCVFFHIRFSCFYRDYSGGDCSILKNRYQLIIYKKCIDKFYIEWLFFLLNLFFPPPPPLEMSPTGGLYHQMCISNWASSFFDGSRSPMMYRHYIIQKQYFTWHNKCTFYRNRVENKKYNQFLRVNRTYFAFVPI